MDKKDLALVILSKKKPGMEDGKKSESMSTDSETSRDEMAAEEILAAIKSQDAKELGSLLKDFVSMCKSEDYESEEESEES